MKKFMLALLVTATMLPACCVGHVPHPEAGMNLPEQLDHRTLALVQWVAPDDEGNPIVVDSSVLKARLLPYCAAVWVSNTQFLTAEHCVAGLGMPPRIAMLKRMAEALPELGIEAPEWDPTGQPVLYSNFEDIKDAVGPYSFRSSHPAVVEAIDEDLDLALVKATPDAMDDTIVEHTNVRIATEVRVGDNAHVVGHPSRLWWTYVHGIISAIRPNVRLNPEKGRIDMLQISAPIFHGNSGGGAWNDNGELIGICKSMHSEVPNTGFFVRYNVVRGFLSLYGVK